LDTGNPTPRPRRGSALLLLHVASVGTAPGATAAERLRGVVGPRLADLVVTATVGHSPRVQDCRLFV